MRSREPFSSAVFGMNWTLAIEAIRIRVGPALLMLLFLFITLAAQSAHGQYYQVIHDFDGPDSLPANGVTMDSAGNLYGTTVDTVFKMSQSDSGWDLLTLYKFMEGPSFPGEILIGRDGTLFSTTYNGGDKGCDQFGCGTVFELKPQATAGRTPLRPWLETVLHPFSGDGEGSYPTGGLISDPDGNLYGTTIGGGVDTCNRGCGTVYRLTPSGNGWTITTLYAFKGGSDGSVPESAVVANAGKLYGTTALGGSFGWGIVYELTAAGSGWTERAIYEFQGADDGQEPVGGLTVDESGDLYGTTVVGGSGGGGTVFKLTNSNGNWTFKLLYSFEANRAGPDGSLVMDAAHNLYGTVSDGGIYGYGSVFELSPSAGLWTYRSLHDFCEFCDGAEPSGKLIRDASGNLYGTAYLGGNGGCSQEGCGVVWEITP